MTDFSVNYPELRAAAAGFDGLRGDAASQAAVLSGIPLTQPDFGRIPWLQTRVYEAYSEHTSQCQDALGDLVDALKATSEGLTTCASAYASYDKAAAEAIASFFEEVL